MTIPPTILIEAKTLPEAWQKLVRTCMRDGAILKSEYGNSIKDICAVTFITHPFEQPFLHPSFPTKSSHCTEYNKQWKRDYDWIKQGFEYNYMDRIINYPLPNKNTASLKHGTKYSAIANYYDRSGDKLEVDQITEISKTISSSPLSRRKQVITWIPSRDLFVKEDQPCLQRIWFRNLGNNKLEIHCMWRSRDLFTAWNSNYSGLLTMLQEEIITPNNLRVVKLIDFCNSLHIYDYDWEQANNIENISTNPQLQL